MEQHPCHITLATGLWISWILRFQADMVLPLYAKRNVIKCDGWFPFRLDLSANTFSAIFQSILYSNDRQINTLQTCCTWWWRYQKDHTHNLDKHWLLYTFSNDWLTVWQLCLNYFIETYDLIIEDFYHKLIVIDQQSYELKMLNTVEQKYKELTEQWIRYDENFILVYSITSKSLFSNIMKFHEQIELMKECMIPVMLMSNKNDKETKRVVSAEEKFILIKKLKCKFLETLVKNYLTVKKIFHNVI